MKISYNWLKSFYNLDLTPDKVAEMLTGCGLEVECQEPYSSIKGGLRGIVTGEVMTCRPHPNSDHLSLTTVNIGKENPLSIVCGAANVASGQKVLVATIGSVLFFNDKEVTIQPAKIRGESSEGMICAEDELGLGTSHDGILVLPPDTPAGLAASEYFKVEEDVIFTIGLTPNRIDAASHLGVARDLVAVANHFGSVNEKPAETARLIMPSDDLAMPHKHSTPIWVEVEDPSACPRYSGLTISGIRVGESPGWLKNRLESIGLRPINNVVDITNYILMETGQPLHAFDCDRISGGKVVVRKFPAGTKFTTLDGVERLLSDDDLMIANEMEPMCIAGVFGGLSSGVTEKTTAIFLESACFDPGHVRRTSKRHGLQTDASFRFERGSDIDITVYAMKRAASLIMEVAGGVIGSDIVDIYPVKRKNAEVVLTSEYLNRLTGKLIKPGTVKGILTDLGFGVIESPGASPGVDSVDFTVTVPTCKVDVKRPADVVEEVLRIYGYNNVDFNDEMMFSVSRASRPDPEYAQNLVAEYLVANGFFEAMNNSLSRSSYYTSGSGFPAGNCVRILNPISRDLDVMRQTLLFGLLESVSFNINRKSQDLRFFEFGRTYSTGSGPGDPLPGYHESTRLALMATGRSLQENWNNSANPVDLFTLIGNLRSLARRISVDDSLWEIENFQSDAISGGIRIITGGKEIAFGGLIDGNLLKSFDIRQPVWYLETAWDLILSLIGSESLRYVPVPRFPEVRRDLALLVDRSVRFDQIAKLARSTEKKLLKAIGLFDVYEGEKIGAGLKSYAVGFILMDENKTLTDKEIDKTMERLVQVFKKELNASLR